MSTELSREAELNIDTLQTSEEVSERVARIEEEAYQYVSIHAAFESLQNVKLSLLSLRAANLGAIVSIGAPIDDPDPADRLAAIAFLRDWDQLMLTNALKLLGDVVPEKAREALNQEAKIEAKWFKEWVAAAHDPRMMKYPGIPWVSFIRKTVGENYTFASELLEHTEMTEDKKLERIKAFLAQKKQAVCIFPKQWKQNEQISN